MKHWIIVIVAITLMILHERLSAILERDYSHTHSDWNDIYFCKWQNPIYSKKSVSLCSSEYTVFFGDWGTGRDKYKKLQQAEINKMKAKDM